MVARQKPDKFNNPVGMNYQIVAYFGLLIIIFVFCIF